MSVNRSMPASTVIPVLLYDDVPAAVAWLSDAFGFVERLRIGDHRAQLTFGGGAVVVARRARAGAPDAADHSVMVRVGDANAHCARASAAGARVVQPPTSFSYGERQYTAIDPGGHAWTFSQSVADVHPETWGGVLQERVGYPDTRQLVRSQVSYCAWANGRLLAACSTLSADERNRDLQTSHVSVLGTLRHMYYAERVWLRRLRENAMPPLVEVGDQRLFQDPPPEPDLDGLLKSWPLVSEGLREYCETTPEADLAGDLCGVDCRMTRWQVLVHLVNHSSQHRGQVVGLLRQLGKQPPNTDIFGFYLQLDS